MALQINKIDQTAIQIFWENLQKFFPDEVHKMYNKNQEQLRFLYEQAKAMEKTQMIEFAHGFWNWAKGGDWDDEDIKQYFNETYNK